MEGADEEGRTRWSALAPHLKGINSLLQDFRALLEAIAVAAESTLETFATLKLEGSWEERFPSLVLLIEEWRQTVLVRTLRKAFRRDSASGHVPRLEKLVATLVHAVGPLLVLWAQQQRSSTETNFFDETSIRLWI